jgi:hypothetical protein
MYLNSQSYEKNIKKVHSSSTFFNNLDLTTSVQRCLFQNKIFYKINL